MGKCGYECWPQVSPCPMSWRARAFIPKRPRCPSRRRWDLVGEVDRLSEGVTGIEPGQIVAALPIHGAYAEFVCLPQRELVPVPPGLDAAEAVSLVLNYITAYQMLHRSAKVRPGQRVLFHGASGGVGTALLQLGRLAELEMYGTCSSRGASAVSELGGVPIDYRNQDYVTEIHRLTSGGVDAVFDPIGGAHLWHSRDALRPGGKVIGYGNTTSLREGLGSRRTGRRNRFHGIPVYALYIAGGWVLPGRKRVVPYSIQTLKRLRPALFRQDMIALFDLLQQKEIQAAHRATISPVRGKTCAGVAREGRRDRQDRPRARRIVTESGSCLRRRGRRTVVFSDALRRHRRTRRPPRAVIFFARDWR